MRYKDAEQQKLREERILKALQQANERGENCKYSEEQILEAQHQLGKEKLCEIFSKVIDPITSALLYLIYTVAALIIIPVSYCCGKESAKPVAVIAVVLLLASLIVICLVKRSVKNNTEKNRKWAEHLIHFSNETYALGYIVTTFGYLSVITHYIIFWYIYWALTVAFLVAAFYDLFKPFVTYLRQHFGSRKSASHKK